MDGKALLGAAICGGIAGSLATMLLMKTPAAPAATAAAPAATAAVPAANINVPKQQLDPVEYEAASGSASSTDRDSRLLRRVETVLMRRTQRVIVVLERLCDGHNYAAVLRTCEATGVQHVWLVAPPQGDARYESANMQKRRETLKFAQKVASAEANCSATDNAPQPDSRRQRRRAKRVQAADGLWDADAQLDQEHAAFGKNSARFLSVREFATAELCLAALRAEGRTVWATDLGQGAHVLAPGAAWLGATPGSLPDKLALVIGTESTGVSALMLAAADRRVYLPQHGFADSLNASVAAALCLHTLLSLYGPRAVGDLAAEGRSEEVGALRRSWCGHLARDAEEEERMLAAIAEREGSGGVAVLDDLRRPEEYRQHNGKQTPAERRRTHKLREARLPSQAAAPDT